VEGQRRRHCTKEPEIRILYAAFEKDAFERDSDAYVADVLDLTQFKKVVERDSAIDDLMRHGRADSLHKLVKEEHKLAFAESEAGQVASNPGLDRLARTAKDFADGLATARIPGLIAGQEVGGKIVPGLAADLEAAIRSSESYLRGRIPPLAGQIGHLRSWTSELAAPRAISHPGVAATWRLARRYASLQRYAEMACALRECLISAWTVLHRDGDDVAQWHSP
jgi:hypothetical protein